MAKYKPRLARIDSSPINKALPPSPPPQVSFVAFLHTTPAPRQTLRPVNPAFVCHRDKEYAGLSEFFEGKWKQRASQNSDRVDVTDAFVHMELTSFCNYIACRIKMGDYQGAEDICQKQMKVCAVKYAWAVILICLSRYASAGQTLSRARNMAEHDPGNMTEIHQLSTTGVVQLQEAINYEFRIRKTYMRMISFTECPPVRDVWESVCMARFLEADVTVLRDSADMGSPTAWVPVEDYQQLREQLGEEPTWTERRSGGGRAARKWSPKIEVWTSPFSKFRKSRETKSI